MAYHRTKWVESRLADNRERMLSAARDVVSAGGFRDAQIATIALKAGVAVGTIYRYFPSRAHLFAEVLEVTARLEVEAATRVAAVDEPAVQRLAAVVCGFARRAIGDRRLAYALAAEPVEPAVDEARLAYRRALAKVFEGILQDGIESGTLPPQGARASASCLVGALIESLVGPLAPTPDPVDDGESLVEAIALFCLRAVSGRDE